MTYAIHDFGKPKPTNPEQAPAAAPTSVSTEPTVVLPAAVKAAARTMRLAAADRIDAHFYPPADVARYANPYLPTATLGAKSLEHAAIVPMFSSRDVAGFLETHGITTDRQSALDAFHGELKGLLAANGFQLEACEYASDGTMTRIAVTDPTYVAAARAADKQVGRLFNDTSDVVSY